MNQTWDAGTYAQKFSFVHQYGNDVADLLEGRGVRTVLDVGCGNGELSNRLMERGFLVTGLDGSEDMLALARKNYPQITFLHADATDFSLAEPVDAVFSNAVFHWIDRERQGALLRCVHDALRPGGQFVFEFGGRGNNALIHDALADCFSAHGHSYTMPFYFPSVGEYATLLEAAGFCVRQAFLFDRPTPLEGSDGLSDWILMFASRPFEQESISTDEKHQIISEAVSRLCGDLFRDGVWYADYVRLRMKAVRCD